MTRGELRLLVSRWVDDLQNGYFTVPEINTYLNNAQYEVQKLLIQAAQNYYLKCVQTNLVINQNFYALPDDFLKLHRLIVIVSGQPPTESTVPLTPITLNQQDYLWSKTGTPQAYVFKKDKLWVFPTPDTVMPIRLFYSYRVTNMVTDNQSPDVPEHYHEFLAVLATQDCLTRDGRDITPILNKKAYYENMLKQDANERNQDLPRQIVVSDSYSNGGDTVFY